jgi:hypothetical protein
MSQKISAHFLEKPVLSRQNVHYLVDHLAENNRIGESKSQIGNKLC